MRNTLLLLAGIMGAYTASAQNITPENDQLPRTNGYKTMQVHSTGFLSHIVADVNFTGGTVNQKLTLTDPTANYPKALNTRVNGVKAGNVTSTGIDAEIGYYFDLAGRYGIGTGIMYTHQSGDLTMDNFHIEYQSKDVFNNTFRQVLTATGPIREQLRTSNISIPLLFKYRLNFGRLGFNADAGLVFNLSERTSYKTNAAFDYEAIYQYTGTQGNLVPVYDNSATPAPGDLLITKAQYLATYPGASVTDYFNTQHNLGYNVGLNRKPDAGSGHVSSVTGSVGLLFRPSLNVMLTQAFSVNVGVYYLYQNFKNNVPQGYRLTDKVGQYDPLVAGVQRSMQNNYGISIGASYAFRKVHHVLVVPAEDTSGAPVDDDKETDLPASGGGAMGGSSGHNLQADVMAQPLINSDTDESKKAGN